jgi:hypothetical protein
VSADKKRQPDYGVGYGRPPDRSRFRKGQPGNPSGRRPYAESRRAQDLIRKEAYRRVSVREGDTIRELPAIQVAMRGLFVAAAKGKPSALKIALAILESLEKEIPREIKVTWVKPEEEPIAKIERVIVEPYPGLNQMTPAEREQFERLLEKAKSR